MSTTRSTFSASIALVLALTCVAPAGSASPNPKYKNPHMADDKPTKDTLIQPATAKNPIGQVQRRIDKDTKECFSYVLSIDFDSKKPGWYEVRNVDGATKANCCNGEDNKKGRVAKLQVGGTKEKPIYRYFIVY